MKLKIIENAISLHSCAIIEKVIYHQIVPSYEICIHHSLFIWYRLYLEYFGLSDQTVLFITFGRARKVIGTGHLGDIFD